MGTSATKILGRTQLAGLFVLLFFFSLDTTHLDGLIFEVQEEFRWHITGSTRLLHAQVLVFRRLPNAFLLYTY